MDVFPSLFRPDKAHTIGLREAEDRKFSIGTSL